MSGNIEAMSRELIRLFRKMIQDVGNAELKQQIRSRLDKELFDLAYYGYKQRRLGTLLPAALDLGPIRLLTMLRARGNGHHKLARTSL